MISDRFVVPEIEIANPPDAISRARAHANSSVQNWEDFLGMTNDDERPYHNWADFSCTGMTNDDEPYHN